MRSSMKTVPLFASLLWWALLIVAVPIDVPADAPKPAAPDLAGDSVAAIKLDRVGSWGGGYGASQSIGWEFETAE